MKKMYHYTECGLDHIYLVSGYSVASDGTLHIQDIHGLHRCIGELIVFQGRKLKAKEIRFIRHYMDLSQKAFGEMLGVEYISVHRWETGRIVIPKTADRLLRVLFREYLDPSSKAREVIDILSDVDNNRGAEKVALVHKKQWKTAA